MPAVIGVIAAVVTIGTGIYTAVDASNARAKSLDIQKKALEAQGIVDEAQKHLLEAETNAVQDKIFEQPANTTTPSSSTNANGIDLGTVAELSAVGLIAFVGYKALTK